MSQYAPVQQPLFIQSIALFRNWRGVTGTHCLYMRGSPGFSGELGNYGECSHACTKQWIPGTPLRFFSSAWEWGYSSL